MANCETCKYLWEDRSVGYRECTCEDEFTEKEMVDFVEDEKDGCPHYVEAEVIDEYEYQGVK